MKNILLTLIAFFAMVVALPSPRSIPDDEVPAAIAACEDRGMQTEWKVSIAGPHPRYYLECKRRFNTDGLGTRPWNWRNHVATR